MLRLALLSTSVIVVLGLFLAGFAQRSMGDAKPPSPTEWVAGSSSQVLRGAESYDLICSDCHGDTGLGIAEGKLSFEPEHQRCERCHRPFNAPTKANVEISEKNAFNIGEPPPLRGEGMLAHFADASVLYAYLSAAMPRYDPGSLDDETYLDLTAFLLELNGHLPKNAHVTKANAASLKLR